MVFCVRLHMQVNLSWDGREDQQGQVGTTNWELGYEDIRNAGPLKCKDVLNIFRILYQFLS